jgi:hypothetical protein
MPYWINSMLAATPALAWMFLGLGLPWALIILPRRDWRDWPTVACLTLAFGPALLTAWMFILGSVQNAGLLRLDLILVGTAIMAVVGWIGVWRKKPHPLTPSPQVERGNGSSRMRQASSLQLDEKLLLALIGVALVVRWIGVAYWPSTAYDALWVYAYEGKLYTLLGYIPNTIGYYPQFLPLQHTFLQLAVGGVDDHAARAVLPWLHLGSIFAAYILGNKLFNRRVGIYMAAIWALYPHVAEWSRFGDLEIPVAFLFTAAAAFFLRAWNNPRPLTAAASPLHREGEYGRRYAIIAGLLLGIGMWTKPTMGAFIWGVALLVGIEVVRQFMRSRETIYRLPTMRLREAFRAAWPRIQMALWAGVASIPLGAVWYVRNVLTGHNPIDLPPGFWQTLAAQSGVEFGWPLLAVMMLLAWAIFSYQRSAISRQQKESTIVPQGGFAQGQREDAGARYVLSLRWARLIVGLALVLAGVVPSILSPHRMGILEWLALGTGSVVLYVTLRRWAEGRWTDEGRSWAGKIGWASALALPYFVTWFFSYSYHYRLSFAIVPLMILPTAVIVAEWTKNIELKKEDEPQRHREHRGGIQRRFQIVYLVILLLLAFPSVVVPLYDSNAGWDWLWTDRLPDDHARYQSGNLALMAVVDGLQAYLDTHDEPLRVVAPGVKGLPFFFPTEDIRIDHMPTRLFELEGVTYFVYGVPETGGDFNTFIPGQNQVLDGLALAANEEGDFKAVLRRAWWKDDGVFKYTVYELDLGKRWEKPEVTIQPEGDVVFGGFVRYMGYDILAHEFWYNRKVITNFFWEVLQPPPADYVIYIHLRDKDDQLIVAWDAPITRTDDGTYYSSLVWDAGEYIIDRRVLKVTDPNVPLDDDYHIVIGLYDRLTQERVPLTIDGEPAGDGFQLAEPFSFIPGEG